MNPEKEQLEGTVKTITFHNDENHYTVAQVHTDDLLPVTVVGAVPQITVGGRYIFFGRWDTHKKFGRQFKIESFTPVLPSSEKGIERYLGSGLIKGVGPATAKLLVKHFKTETLDVIDKEPGRLRDIPGIGKKKAAVIRAGWEAQKGTQEIFLFLQEHNISPGLSVKIYNQYKEQAVPVLKRNPYRLADDVWGVGFKTADTIARDLGLAPDAPERIASGLIFCLREAAGDGNCYLPREELTAAAAALLDVADDLISAQLDTLILQKKVLDDDGRVYPAFLHQAEAEVCTHFRRLTSHPHTVDTARFDREFRTMITELGFTPSPEQERAVTSVRDAKILVVTGGPGTGKTTTLKAIAKILDRLGLNIRLAAPTGRAAKRMTEATGYPASTIHRLLEYNPGKGGFQKNAKEMLETDALIVDECSMMDVVLMRDLLCALPPAARLVLVGDRDQLPSVGPGNVLRDVIESAAVTTVNLNRIFRQAEKSTIIVNAHRINAGEMPLVPKDGDRNFFMLEKPDPADIPGVITDLVTRRLPSSYGFDPVRDIQVISPMYKSETGVTRLNNVLQEALNPHGTEVVRGGTVYRVGDKVMQIRNNYDKGVFNGDAGVITAVDTAEQELQVRFDNPVIYDFGELDEIVHAYAITVHKSQGSEYPAVIMPVVTQHYMMLQRNLLYTAVTRAKEILILVGTSRAVAIAVKNDAIRQRYTGLRERLEGLQ